MVRVLYISDRRDGGIKRHVQCLRACLSREVEQYAVGEDEPFAGKSGHDVREWFQIRRVVKTFQPDIIHFHTPNLFMALYARLFSKAKRVCSWHTPTGGTCRWGEQLFLKLLGDCYYLPVSTRTWQGLQKWLPHAKGEVFYNPLRITKSRQSETKDSQHRVIGMVGRNADVKDWPSFHRVAELVGCEAWNLGEKAFCPNGREKIAEMTVYVLTSKSEEMPTSVLECFAEKTAICGFIPVGGMSEILSYSTGPLKSVFIQDRDCAKLAEIVKRLLDDASLREAVIEDGWQILTKHFDAEKNVQGQLMRIYKRLKVGGGKLDKGGKLSAVQPTTCNLQPIAYND